MIEEDLSRAGMVCNSGIVVKVTVHVVHVQDCAAQMSQMVHASSDLLVGHVYA